MGLDIAFYGGPEDGWETEVIPAEPYVVPEVLTAIDTSLKEHYYMFTGEKNEKGFFKYTYRGYKYACHKL